ncbi:MAG: glucose-1-phosphate adenylyltransferase [Candidatus Eisenbacteria bacterium]|uniref:Glucose-1-phosphate adenylyltransferase n=1 Tax=Eiseniibacteriota bacterium TaxID=2212470 RepID=A0A849STK0_UNCEI|nr:glucose-1-phosphate adenylyltransferase [Candidatus Eisenbacteria bacterium]
MAHTMAVVLSGGGGERLSVLTSERAVSAVPFGGKYRIIDFVLSNCCHSGLERVAVLTQHAPTSLHDHIGSGRAWDLDRRTGGVQLLQPYLTREHAGWYRGTADALAQNWDVLGGSGAANTLVLSGDHVYKMDYRALLRTHEESGARVTLAVTAVEPDESWRFGMVAMDRNGRVTALEEKPRQSSLRLASMGIYLFDTEVLGEAIAKQPVDLVLDVLRPLIEKGERVFAHEHTGYWDDVGTLKTFYETNLGLLAREPRLVLNDGRWPILTRDEERPPVQLLPGAMLDGALIANGCRVSGRIRNSILFPGVTVGADAEIVDSVIMQDVTIGAGARVDRAIVDKYVRVGASARVGDGLAMDVPELAWLHGLTLVGKDCVLPDHARVGRQAILGVGASSSDFVDGAIAVARVVPDRVSLTGSS